jgi:hypothetical protein
MNDEKNREYYVPFKGCRPLNKRQAKQVGFTLIFGFVAAGILALTFGKGILSASLILAVTIVAYFFGQKLFGN